MDGLKIQRAKRRGGGRFASGRMAKAQCPVTGDVVPYGEMRQDWRGVWVSPEGLDPRHPLDVPTIFDDPETLHHPAPLLDQGTTDAVTQLEDTADFTSTFGAGGSNEG